MIEMRHFSACPLPLCGFMRFNVDDWYLLDTFKILRVFAPFDILKEQILHESQLIN